MRNVRMILRGVALIITATMILPAGIQAQNYGEPVQNVEEVQDYRFTAEELTQMLAPIALYPDSLIAQILMASTYPLEIVEAERWLRRNKELTGDALNEALKDKPWDPSVKGLCHFPDLLFAMSDKLDQTRKLGDAFLAQEGDVMATIQELRRRAEEQGNLRTTAEQKVIVEREVIMIEPADPQIVYVPVYDPFYVYGPWWYPAYPPFYWYYPPTFVLTGGHIVFGPRVFIGFGLFSWSWFDWHRHIIFIDFHKTSKFHRHRIKRDFDRPFHWRHDPRHRRGVSYRDRRTSEHFGQIPSRRQVISPETRGFPPGGIERRTVEPSRTPSGPRGRTIQPGVPPRGVERRTVEPSRAPSRPRGRTIQPGVPPRGVERTPQFVPRRDTPFGGVDRGTSERRAGERGRESRSGGTISPGREIRQPVRDIRGPERDQGGSGGGTMPRGGGSRDRGGGGGQRR